MKDKLLYKIKDWFKRYFFAEVFSYSLAIWWGSLVFYMTSNYYLSWVVVIIGDHLWYYLTIFIREILNTYKINKTYNTKLLIKDFRNLLFEFWWPLLIESFVVSPILMFYIPRLFSNYSIWVFITMTATVIIFYLQAVILYEIRKKYFT